MSTRSFGLQSPFGLSLSPTSSRKVTLALLREMSILIRNYLKNWLILAHSQDHLYEHRGAPVPQPSGKHACSPCIPTISFLGMELDLVNMTACPISAKLLEFFQGQDSDSRAYDIHSRGHTARIASYETTSALATWQSPEIGMAPWHTSGEITPICRCFFNPRLNPPRTSV